MILYLTGQPGAGKTTIANALNKIMRSSVVIDGDRLREITENKDYSPEGRKRNLELAHSLALILEAEGYIPIVAMVSPFRSDREALKKKGFVIEYYIHTTDTERPRANFKVPYYEKPLDNFVSVSTDLSLVESLTVCIEAINNVLNYGNISAEQNQVTS